MPGRKLRLAHIESISGGVVSAILKSSLAESRSVMRRSKSRRQTMPYKAAQWRSNKCRRGENMTSCLRHQSGGGGVAALARRVSENTSGVFG